MLSSGFTTLTLWFQPKRTLAFLKGRKGALGGPWSNTTCRARDRETWDRKKQVQLFVEKLQCIKYNAMRLPFLMFSDEATFHLDGHVYQHSCQHWLTIIHILSLNTPCTPRRSRFDHVRWKGYGLMRHLAWRDCGPVLLWGDGESAPSDAEWGVLARARSTAYVERSLHFCAGQNLPHCALTVRRGLNETFLKSGWGPIRGICLGHHIPQASPLVIFRMGLCQVPCVQDKDMNTLKTCICQAFSAMVDSMRTDVYLTVTSTGLRSVSMRGISVHWVDSKPRKTWAAWLCWCAGKLHTFTLSVSYLLFGLLFFLLTEKNVWNKNAENKLLADYLPQAECA